jgi:transposase-like protein
MTKVTRARYTLEFEQEAVRLVESGQSIAAASRTLGFVEQTLFNWVKAHREGALKGNATFRSSQEAPLFCAYRSHQPSGKLNSKFSEEQSLAEREIPLALSVD